MAKRIVSRPKTAAKKKEPGPITVLHVCNALAQIESWVYYVREVLANLDARMEIPIRGAGIDAGVLELLPPMRLACPPGSTLGPIHLMRIGCPPPVVIQPPQQRIRIGCPPPIPRRRTRGRS